MPTYFLAILIGTMLYNITDGFFYFLVKDIYFNYAFLNDITLFFIKYHIFSFCIIVLYSIIAINLIEKK